MTRKVRNKLEKLSYIADKMPVAYVDDKQEPLRLTIDRVNVITKSKWTKDKLSKYHCRIEIIS